MTRDQTMQRHYGGWLGILTLVTMLAVSGCMAFAQSGGTNWGPAWGPLAQSQPLVVQNPAVSTAQPAATFIVRVKDDPVITSICRSYRRDEDSAQAQFKSWQASHPETHGLTLEGASYSGEIILGLPAADRYNRTSRDVLAALRNMDSVAYAEIDEEAHPSGEGP